MKPSLLLLARIIIAAAVPGTDQPTGRVGNIHFSHLHAVRAPSVDTPTSHYQSLDLIPHPVPPQHHHSSHHLRSLIRKQHLASLATTEPDGLLSADPPAEILTPLGTWGTVYAITVDWAGTLVRMILDTGSADTWAVKSTFTCYPPIRGPSTPADHVLPREMCGFDATYVDDFTHGAVTGLHLAVAYASGEEIYGPMGQSDLSICNGQLTVRKQLVALADHCAWYGDNQTSGLLGLAFPTLTNSYHGNETERGFTQWTVYTPFFSTLVSQGDVEPKFTIALSRHGGNESLIAWGGIMPIPYDGSPTTADLIIANLIQDVNPAMSWKYSFYAIMVDGFVFGDTEDTTQYPYVVDSGTTLNYLPPPLVEQIAAAFDPPAFLSPFVNTYFVACDTIAPRMAVIIGGQRLYFNPKDLVVPMSDGPDDSGQENEYCAIGFSSGWDGPYVLGTVFLRNVIAVFDVGAAEMRFYPREVY